MSEKILNGTICLKQYISEKEYKEINEKNIYEIELDVECKNNTALNLYKSCGFKEISVMSYYKYNV